MRMHLIALAAAMASGAALAQTGTLPLTSRAEGQVDSLNRSMLNQQQDRAQSQQNQFETNSLRNDLSRQSAPQPPSVIVVPRR